MNADDSKSAYQRVPKAIFLDGNLFFQFTFLFRIKKIIDTICLWMIFGENRAFHVIVPTQALKHNPQYLFWKSSPNLNFSSSAFIPLMLGLNLLSPLATITHSIHWRFFYLQRLILIGIIPQMVLEEIEK